MSAPTAPVEDLSIVLNDIQTRLNQCDVLVNSIGNAVDFVLGQLPETLVGGIRKDLAEMQRAFNDRLDEQRERLAHAGNPAALRAAGAAWARDIGGAASRLAAVPTLNMTRADDHWTGIAAEAYRSTLPAQNAALTALKTTGDEIDASLNQLANAISTFWVSVDKAVIALDVALISALAAAVTTAGAPVAVGIAVAALAAFGLFVADMLGALNDIVNECHTRSAELERRFANDTAFPLGEWPRSTTEISGDGSITDGDDTDWHVR